MSTINWRTKQKIQAEAIDTYEKEHKLGKYEEPVKTVVKATAPPPTYPTEPELAALSWALYERLLDGSSITRKEEVTQHFDLALFHLKVVNREITRAMRQ